MKALRCIVVLLAVIMAAAYIIPDTASAESRTLTSAIFVTIKPATENNQAKMPQDIENMYMDNVSQGQKIFVKEEKLAQGGNGLYTMAQML
ncbi:MAG: hypothetical protein WC779_06745 [Candidatus Omnitrophota bacterium]